MKIKDTGLLPEKNKYDDLPVLTEESSADLHYEYGAREGRDKIIDQCGEIDLTEAFEKYLEKIGWKGLFEEWAFKLWVKEQGYIKLSDVELDVEKIKEMFDDRLVRVFDPTDAEYKNVRLTGAEADLIAKTVLANSKEVVRIKEEI